MEVKKPNISFIPEDEIENYIIYSNKDLKLPLLKNKILMEKQVVYQRIDGELVYQDIKWENGLRSDRVPDSEKPIAEWLNYIEFHLDKAKNQNYHLNKDGSLDELRKVAALAIRALMIHGCPERDLSGNGGNAIWDSNKNIWVNSKTGEPINFNSSCSCENCECKKNQ